MISFKHILTVSFGLFVFLRAQPQILEINEPIVTSNYWLFTSEQIVAPGSQYPWTIVSQDAKVDYKAGEVIELKNGFGAGGFNGNGFFHAFIDPHVSMPVDYDDNLFSQQDFDDHEIDVSKPVGYIPGTHSVTPTGAAAYTIPIPLPPGTNGMVPSLAITYNSQSGNGILGMGWNIAGLSAISRVPKTIYHNEKVEAVQLDATDNFALDGNRLIKVGNYYYTEAETFSRIRGESVSGSTPQGFEVETKNGQTIYYGYTSDSRFYKENTNEILFWLINKIKDNYGNYVEFIYRQENREVVIDKISYTGNENAGLTPYNHIQFYYDYRDDKNTAYIAGASINSNLILKKIKITADGQDFKTFKFTYGINLYSFLKEVHEFGSDGSEVNSTVFKYGDNTDVIEKETTSLYRNGNVDVFTGDFNGDGLSDAITADRAMFNSNPEVWGHTNFKLFFNTSALIGAQETFAPNPSETVTLNNGNYQIQGVHIPYGHNFISGDYNGDGKDDLLLSDISFDGGYSLNNLKIYYSDGLGFNSTNIYSPPATHTRLHNSKKCIFPGDFDGDGAIDIIFLLSDGSIYKAFYLSPRISNEYVEIPAAVGRKLISANEIQVIDFDGDGKHELLSVSQTYPNGVNNPATEIYRFNVSNNDISSEVVYTGSPGFPTEWHTIYPGDFNGDGKTDLLTKVNDDDWFLDFSTGTGFNEQSFIMNNFNPDNPFEVKTGDYNGDGKSDILFTYGFDVLITGPNGQHTIVPRAKSDFYISNGQSFLFFPDLTEQNWIENASYSGDFNGDGKLDELSLRSQDRAIDDPIDIFYFNRDCRNLFLEQIKNGFNQTVKFDYSWLSQKKVNSWTLDNEEYPLNRFKKQLLVLNSLTLPDGIGGNNITEYTYEHGILHKGGKGFLGFNKIFAENNVTEITEGSEYEIKIIDEKYYLPILKKQWNFFQSPFNIISETNSYYELTELGDEIRFWNKCTLTTSADYLNSFIDNSITYEYYPYADGGNIKKITTVAGPETSVSEFGNYETHGSWAANSPSSLTKNNTRGTSTFSATSKYEYNDKGSLTKEIAFFNLELSKRVTTDYQYDNNLGNLTQTTISNPELVSRTARVEYDSKGRFAIKKYNALDQREEYTYDNRWGKPVTAKSISGLITTFEYDGFGSLKKTTDPHGLATIISNNWSIGSVEHAVYFSKTTKPGTPENIVVYDAFGRSLLTKSKGFNSADILTTQTYNERGNLKTQSNSFQLGGVAAVITEYEYDDYNRPESATNDISTTNYEYMAGNGLSSVKIINQQSGQWSKKTTDASGKVVKAEDIGGTLEYFYYATGNLEKTKLNGVDMTLSEEDSYYGRQKSLWDANGGLTQYEYNAYGELEKQTDARQNIYEMEYDMLGRMAKKTKSGEPSTVYAYVENGNGINQIEKITGFNGATQEYFYDSFNRLIQFKEAITGEEFSTYYTYDNNNNVTSITYPSEFKIKKFYDANGYLTSIKNHSNQPIFIANEANALGQLTQYTMGNGITTEKIFNQFGLLERIKTPGASIQDLELTFEIETGNLLSRVDHVKQLGESFGYDDLNRLTSASVFEISDPLTPLYAPMLTGYAANGNINNKTGIGQYYYESNLPNAVTAVDNSNQPEPLVSTMQQNVTYTAFDRPHTISENYFSLSFVYGPDNNRIKSELRESGQLIKSRYYSRNYERVEIGSDVYEVNYISGGDGLCAIAVSENGDDEEYFYVYKDYLGSILTLTYANGNIAAEQNFDAWGNFRNPETWEQIAATEGCGGVLVWLNRGFTGHEHLPEFALVNINARLYDPLLGRMLAVDNFIQNPYSSQSYNRFGYVWNNPLAYTDPDGEWVNYVIGAIMGGYSGYQIGKAQGATGWDLVGYTWLGSSIGFLSAGIGSMVGTAVSSASNALVGATVGGAASGAFSGVSFAALSGGDVGQGITVGAISGALGGVTSAGIGGGTGAFVGGAVSGGVGTALSGGNVEESMNAAIMGGAISYAGFELQMAYNYGQYQKNPTMGALKYSGYRKISIAYQRSSAWGVESGGWIDANGNVRKVYYGDKTGVRLGNRYIAGDRASFHTHPYDPASPAFPGPSWEDTRPTTNRGQMSFVLDIERTQMYSYDPVTTPFVSSGQYYYDYYYGGVSHFTVTPGNSFYMIPQYYYYFR